MSWTDFGPAGGSISSSGSRGRPDGTSVTTSAPSSSADSGTASAGAGLRHAVHRAGAADRPRQPRQDGEQDGGPETLGRPPADHRAGREADASAESINRSTSSG